MSDKALTEYGTQLELDTFTQRLAATYPGAKKLNPAQLATFAQYCVVTNVNPWRGEAYPFVDYRGNFHVVDGYKALVRWAKRQMAYSERYVPLTGEADSSSIAYTCYILRNDALPTLQALTGAGMDAQAAFEIAATSAVGVVTRQDMVSGKSGKAIPPPKGWTWHEVARKRALKNALNRSHGAPSPREMADDSWIVNGRVTVADDWQGAEQLPQSQREAIAEGNAKIRTAHEGAQAQMDAGRTGQDAIDEIFGDYVDAEPVIDPDEFDKTGDVFVDETGEVVLPPQSVGKDVKELIEKGKAAPPSALDLLLKSPPPEGQWTPFFNDCVLKLNYRNPTHASKVKDEVWTAEKQPTWAELWAHMVKHQQEKGRL